MKLKSIKFVPILIAISTIGFACFFQSAFFIRHFDLFEHLELKTYDQRVKAAIKFPKPCSTNLSFVRLDEVTLKLLSENSESWANLSWPFPRQMHGRLVRELSKQQVKAIGFDVIFGELRDLDAPVVMPDNSMMESDEFFAAQMRAAGNVILAAEASPIDKSASADERSARNLQRVFPPPLFATNAMAVGDIAADSDADGVLRRARAFVDDPDYGRRWHMGIILAAKELGLDLKQALIRPQQIILNSSSGVQRTIPIDAKGFFYINWSIPVNHPSLSVTPYALPIFLDEIRRTGTPELYRETLESFRKDSGFTNLIGDNPFKDKIVVIGSILIGNNLTDTGATPLNKKDFLVSKHWNVANSVITNQFIRRSSHLIDLLIIIAMGTLAAVLTLKLRAVSASAAVVAILCIYVAACFLLYVQYLYWIPIVIPVIGAMLMTHVCMVTYRVRAEQKERRRVKAVFSRIVSPNVVNELLNTEKLSLGGARRKITVFFADVRGFTEMTDVHQARAEEYVRENNLTPEAAEAHYDEQARETLATVNTYLGVIADKVKEHYGTLDKYIGDCVMAFWGAPTPNEKHALCCVRAAIDAQRGMHALNLERAAENQRREQANPARITAGQRAFDMLPLLSLGSGINSGTVIVGLMGSDAHILNYTVFGREVNLASRLEGVSGRGRIIIGEGTYRDLQRDDPKLAATCVELPSVTVKGIKNAVKIYEVPWKQEIAPAIDKSPSSVKSIPVS